MKTVRYAFTSSNNPLKLLKYYKTSSKDDAAGFRFLTMNLKVFDLYIFNIALQNKESWNA